MANSNKINTGKEKASKPSNGIDAQPVNQMALGKKNFILIAVAGLMIIVGFVLMLGPSATVDHYEPDIFSTRRIVIGPMIAFLGFVAMAIAIIVSPGKKN